MGAYAASDGPAIPQALKEAAGKWRPSSDTATTCIPPRRGRAAPAGAGGGGARRAVRGGEQHPQGQEAAALGVDRQHDSKAKKAF